MQIYIGHIDKRLNSTKRSITGTWTTKGAIDVKLKEPTDIKTPVFLLSREVWVGDPPVLYYRLQPSDNYIYCPEWGYYFIDDIVYETNGLISMITHRDILATGKDYLKQRKLYLSYCSDITKTLTNREIDDDRFGPDFFAGFNDANLEFQSNSIVHKFLVNQPNQGSVLLRAIVGSSGVITYIFNFQDYVDFMQAFFSEINNLANFDLITLNFFGENWRAAILDIKYIPFDPTKLYSFFSSTTQNVMIGKVNVAFGRDIHFTASPYNLAVGDYIIDIPFIDVCDNHYYKFLRGPKYTSVQLEHPGGTIDLSNDCWCVYNKLMVEENINVFTGEYVVKLFATNNNHLKGPQVGILQNTLAMDITSTFQAGTGLGEAMSGIAVNAFKALPMIGASFMTAGAAAIGIQRTAQQNMAHNAQVQQKMAAATAAGKTYHGEGFKEIPTTEKVTLGAQMSLATGITGAFMGGKCGTIGRGGSISSSLSGYFHAEHNDQGATVWVADTFRLTTGTSIPEAFREDINENPSSTNFYPTFCGEYGYPCNRLVDLTSVTENTYVQAVGASIGQVTNPHWTLMPTEISELNNLVNSGIYLEDWSN